MTAVFHWNSPCGDGGNRHKFSFRIHDMKSANDKGKSELNTKEPWKKSGGFGAIPRGDCSDAICQKYLLTRSRGRSLISKLFGTESCALCPVLSRIETFTVTGSADEGLMRAIAVCRFGLIVSGILNSRAGLTAAICALANFSVDGRLQTSWHRAGAAATNVNSSETRIGAGPSHLNRAQPFRKPRSAEVNCRY